MAKAPLHITVSLAVVRKHYYAKSITVATARDRIKQAALDAARGTEGALDKAMREELERRTGVSIAELAAIAEGWPLADQ